MDRVPMPLIAIAGLLMLGLFGSGFVYTGFRILRFLRQVLPAGTGSGGINNIHVFVFICAFFVISIVLSFMPFDMNIKKHLVWFAWMLVGMFLYLLLFFLISDFALLIGRITHLIAAPLPRGAIIISACAVFAMTAGFTGYSIYNAGRIKHVSYDITIEKNSPLESLNAVLISDTHLDYVNDDKWLWKIAREVNSQNPDIVFIAGDVFNNTFNTLQNPDESLKALQSIETKYGIYAVPGNHDGGETFPDMIDFLERGGVTMLQDEHIIIDGSFVVIGRSDLMPIGGETPGRKDTADVLGAAAADNPDGLPVIVIDHQPGAIDEYTLASEDAGNAPDMILAGHTHRGIFFPANVVTYLINRERNYGYSQKDPEAPHVVVTSGIGLWGPPFRLGSNNEVVRLDISFG